MLGYCATHLRIGTDITNFMPDGGRARLASLSRRLANSDLTRTMILSVGADTPARSVAAALELEAMIVKHPEVEWTRSEVPEDILEQVRELFFTRRYYFASDDPENEIPLMVSPTGLDARAKALLSELRQPSSTFFKPLAMDDPLGLFSNLPRRCASSQPDLPTRDGQIVSTDGRFALIMLATVHSHFASDVQAPFLDDLAPPPPSFNPGTTIA